MYSQASKPLTSKQVTCCHSIRLEKTHSKIVKYHILQTSSVKAPLRQHKLITMATTKAHKSRSTHKEREAK